MSPLSSAKGVLVGIVFKVGIANRVINLVAHRVIRALPFARIVRLAMGWLVTHANCVLIHAVHIVMMMKRNALVVIMDMVLIQIENALNVLLQIATIATMITKNVKDVFLGMELIR